MCLTCAIYVFMSVQTREYLIYSVDENPLRSSFVVAPRSSAELTQVGSLLSVKCPSFYQFLTSSCLITCFPCTRNYFTSQGEQRLEAKVRAQGVLPAPGVPASGPRRTELGNLCRMPTQSSIHTYCSVRVCVNSKHHEFTSILLIPFQHHTFRPASPYL